LRRSSPDEASAERELTALLRAVDTGSFADPGKLTVGRYVLDMWLPHIETKVRPPTAARYRSLLVLHVLPVIGSVKMAKLRPAHIQAMLDKVQKTVSARTTAHAYRPIYSALAEAVRLNLLNSNPAAAVRPPRAARPQLTVPSAPDVVRLMNVTEGWLHVAIVLAGSTGMRRGEVLALQWRAVDLDGATAEVSLALENVGPRLEFTIPKTDRSRRKVSIPASTVAFLRRHRTDQVQRRMLLGAAWQGTDLVVERGDGGAIHPGLFSQRFHRLAKKEGLSGVRLHDLRHFYASELLRANVHPKVVSDQLGHSSVAFTMDTYSHLLPSMGKAAAEAIEASLSFERR